MPLPTTRRARYIYRQNRYRRRLRRYLSKKWKWRAHVAGDGIPLRKGPNPDIRPIFKSSPCDVSSRSYNTSAVSPSFIPYVVSDVGPRRPPHVRITWWVYLFNLSLGKHSRKPLIWYHFKRLRHIPAKMTNVRRTARELRITGCNWYYFRNGWFSDDDVLGRHPNDTDIANGAPLPTTLWPVPLGY